MVTYLPCPQVLQRARELAAKVEVDPEDDDARDALILHLSIHAAEHDELLPLVRDEVARLMLDADEEDAEADADGEPPLQVSLARAESRNIAAGSAVRCLRCGGGGYSGCTCAEPRELAKF